MVDALHTLYGNRLGISSSGELLLDGVTMAKKGSTETQSFSGPVKASAFVDTVDSAVSTAAATLGESGLSLIGTTAAAAASWTLPLPSQAGIHKFIRLAYASTAGAHQVAVSTGGKFGQASSNTHIGFGTVDQSVHLVSESTTVWGIYGQGSSIPVTLS